jgi:cytochrome P450
VIDLRSAPHAKDPYPTYAALRALPDPFWDELSRTWYVSRFPDVYRLLLSEVLGSRGIPSWVAHLPEAERRIIEPVEDFYSRWPAFSDRPDHALLRGRLYATLAGSAIRALRDRVRNWTDQVLSNFDPKSSDLVEDLARPLALRCLQEVLGVEAAETDPLITLSNRLIDYLTTTGTDLEAAPGAAAAIADLESFVFDSLLPSAKGLVTAPLAELAASGALERLTICATIAQFLTGTIEPTTTAVTVAIDQSAKSESSRASIREGTISPEAVTEEALRFDSPFHFAPRTALASFELGSKTISADDRVVLLLASANRDSSRWANADSFEPMRPLQAHVAFGRGPHACLGAALARLQTTVAVMAASRANVLDELAQQLDRVPRLGATVLRRVPLA